MRITLEIDDDVLRAVKDLARNRGTTAGHVLSDLARRALEPLNRWVCRNGVPVLPARRLGIPRHNMKLVNRLRN